MSDTNLIALAEKVESLTGPCRETDGLIARAAGFEVLPHPQTADPMYRHYGGMLMNPVPAFTASLDAAMTLVPEGLRLMLSEWDDEAHLRAKGAWQSVLSKPGCDASFDAMRGYRCDHAATPALALTAAALRARAAMDTGA